MSLNTNLERSLLIKSICSATCAAKVIRVNAAKYDSEPCHLWLLLDNKLLNLLLETAYAELARIFSSSSCDFCTEVRQDKIHFRSRVKLKTSKGRRPVYKGSGA